MMPRKNLSQVRAAAGRKGAVARWAGVERKPTEKVRIYAEDANRLRAMPGTIPEALNKILRGQRR